LKISIDKRSNFFQNNRTLNKMKRSICGGACREDISTAPTFPTAVQRVAAASKALQAGNVTMTMSSDDQTILIVSAETAKQVLCHNQQLHKPGKHNKLLLSALTNANGDVWKRQRPAIQRAFGGAKASRQAAVDAAVKCARSAITAGNLDARDVCLVIAVTAMTNAVFGDEGVKVKQPLKALFRPTLEPIRGDVGISNALEQVVRDCTSTLREDSDSLAAKLLKLEVDGVLTREEVIGNCHSALLAGTQTISTTLLGALAHMAEHPELQQESTSSSKNDTRAIVTETLRILPPVGALPRRAVDRALEIHSSSYDASVPQGEIFLIDLVSLAHAGNGESSWTFCPGGKSSGTAAPWGLGDRQCPAGILSVAVIVAVLDALISSGLRWTLANEDIVGERGASG
jgi:cytochrome P450